MTTLRVKDLDLGEERKQPMKTALTSTLELVTPQKAASWLARNTRNRRLNRGVVNKYARDMLNGNWQMTHQGIAFDAEGTLYDGQHRLAAVVQSKTSVMMFVVRGIEPQTITSIDLGKPRSVADVWTMTGRKNVTGVLARTRAIALIETGNSASLSEAEARRVYDVYSNAIDWSVAAVPSNGKPGPFGRATVVGAFAYAYACEAYADVVASFVQQVTSCSGLAPNTPAHSLYQYVAFATREDHLKQMRKVLRAVHAHICGEPMARLYDSVSGIEFFRGINRAAGRGLSFLRTNEPAASNDQ
jgi:hypothetical protein